MSSERSSGDVSADEVARDDIAVSPGAVDVDGIVVAARDHVPLTDVVNALAVGADPVVRGAGRDRHAAAEDVSEGVA